MSKKIFCFLFLIGILILSHNVFADDENEDIDFTWIEEVIQTSSVEEKLTIQSKYGIAYDRSSKSVLWGKDENVRTPMASTTKIMTAIILLENESNLSKEVEVCKQAANIGGSRLGLKKEDKITLEDLLYGLMLCSGNDAAIQIAVSISETVEEFTNLMNEKARQLGLKNTHFRSPHGLDDMEHYTTAYELAILADYALNIEKFSKVVATKNYNVRINNYEKNITNTNELLGYFNGVNGVKTGFTNNAGRCLVTSVNQENFNIITVILGADTKKIRTKDSIKIVNYIYKNFELINIKEKIQEEYKMWKEISEKRIVVNKGTESHLETILGHITFDYYPVNKENIKDIKIEINSIYTLEAPVFKNESIGEIKVLIADKIIERTEIKIKDSIKKRGIFEYFKIFCRRYCNQF